MQAAGGKEACLAQRTTAVLCVVLLPGKLCVHRSTTSQLCSTQNVNDAHLPPGHVALLKQQAMLQTLACNCIQWVADLRVTDQILAGASLRSIHVGAVPMLRTELEHTNAMTGSRDARASHICGQSQTCAAHDLRPLPRQAATDLGAFEGHAPGR